MTRIHPVILCGGSGTRLWPKSRKDRPKPFLKLVGERTLFEQGLARVGRFEAPIIVAGEAHVPLIAQQADCSGGARLVVEPAARNTAPAIALAAHLLGPDDVMLVCPSDQHIADVAAFHDGVQRAAALAREGWLVSFGITPTAPETGFGYIRLGDGLPGGNVTDRFVEKPDLETAQAYLSDGGFVWNGGIFVFTAGRFLEELAAHRPKMAQQLAEASRGAARDGWAIHPAAEPFAAIAGESIDYAVMENTQRAAVVAADMGWSDIGNWDALLEARARDDDGNSAPPGADLVDCRNTLVESDGPRVSVVGLSDIIVVVDGGEVLVTSRAGAQKVGSLPGASSQ